MRNAPAALRPERRRSRHIRSLRSQARSFAPPSGRASSSRALLARLELGRGVRQPRLPGLAYDPGSKRTQLLALKLRRTRSKSHVMDKPRRGLEGIACSPASTSSPTFSLAAYRSSVSDRAIEVTDGRLVTTRTSARPKHGASLDWILTPCPANSAAETAGKKKICFAAFASRRHADFPGAETPGAKLLATRHDGIAKEAGWRDSPLRRFLASATPVARAAALVVRLEGDDISSLANSRADISI